MACTEAIASCACYLLVASLLSRADAHTWLACTDYAEKGGSTWNPGKCRGFARGGHHKAPKTGVFGGDNNFDYLPKEGQACLIPRNDSSEYTRDHPMAVYYPGQQVVLVHPMKNHGADSGCTNIWIPDTWNWIYRSERNAQSDPSLSEFRKNLVFDLGRSRTGEDFNGDHSLSRQYPKPGYQNAPKFCDNPDKAMATFVMNVPDDLRTGLYTFMWLWAFNDMNNLYSSCFEVKIVKNKFDRNRKLIANGLKDMTEPCGGMTSNENIKGNSNKGCKPLRVKYTYPKMPKAPATTPFYHYKQTRTTENENQMTMRKEDKKIIRVESRVALAMKLLQFSGKIELPAPRSTAVRRYYTIDFNCAVKTVNFSNCRVADEGEMSAPGAPGRHYEVVQEGDKELLHLNLYYDVTLKKPCHVVRFAPIAKLIREDYENI